MAAVTPPRLPPLFGSHFCASGRNSGIHVTGRIRRSSSNNFEAGFPWRERSRIGNKAWH